MSASFSTLAKKWSAIRASRDDIYVAVEEFSVTTPWWPYVLIVDQVESTWDDTFRSAIALNLAKHAPPPPEWSAALALATFITLSGPWPTQPTAALNLLTLAHRVAPSTHYALNRFVTKAALRCVQCGLSDSSPLIAEEALNILGGLGAHHFSAAMQDDVLRIKKLKTSVLSRLDDEDIASLLRERADLALGDATVTAALNEADAQALTKELEPLWSQLPSGHQLATLQDHVLALTWATASEKKRAVHVLRIEQTRTKSDADKAFSGWSVIDSWIAVVRDFLSEVVEPYDVVFAPLNAAEGSLVVVLRVDAKADMQDTIAKRLRAAKDTPLTSVAAEDLSNVLSAHKIRIHVAHVEADFASASLDVEPGGGVAPAPLHARRLTTLEIPQANDLDKIFAVVDCVGQGQPVLPQALGVTTDRQSQYYKAAARAIGLLTPTGELTRNGWLVYVANGDERVRRTCVAFESSPCGQAWIEWCGGKKLSDIPVNSAQRFLAARSSLSGDTISRRASTLEGWLKDLRPFA